MLSLFDFGNYKKDIWYTYLYFCYVGRTVYRKHAIKNLYEHKRNLFYHKV